MLARQRAGVSDAIAAQRRLTALRQPMLACGGVDDVEHERLVVSLERDDALVQLRLKLDHLVDDAGALRSAVDVIAEEHKRHGLPVGVSPTTRNQRTQLVQRAVNIADGVDE